MKIFKVLKAFTTTLFLALVVVVGVLVYFSAKGDFYGWRMFIVKSGSMEPTIKTGSLIFVRKESDYKKDDIVTFGSASKADTLVTHRIIEVQEREGNKQIKTKGDFNQVEDKDLSPFSSIIGKFSFGIPYLGYVIDFAKKPLGAVILVVIPGTIIIYDEFQNIRKHIGIMMSNRKKKVETQEETEKE